MQSEEGRDDLARPLHACREDGEHHTERDADPQASESGGHLDQTVPL